MRRGRRGCHVCKLSHIDCTTNTDREYVYVESVAQRGRYCGGVIARVGLTISNDEEHASHTG